MFTGIVETTGTLELLSKENDIHRYKILVKSDFVSEIQTGDSVSVSGICLTAHSIAKASFSVDVSRETRDCTTLGQSKFDTSVNLERAVTPSTRMGGHFVSGHIDSLGTLVEKDDQSHESVLWFSINDSIRKFIAPKGSICVNGVSLTINEVDDLKFSVTIIPHTRKTTTLSNLNIKDKVNIEVDLLARYLENLHKINKAYGT